MRRTGAVVLTAVTMTVALLPAVAGASSTPVPTVPTVPAGTSTEPETSPVRGIIVQTTASDASVARTVEAALPDGVDVAATRGGVGDLAVVQLDATVDAGVVAEAVEEVRQRPDVTLAVPDYVVQALDASPVKTNDTFFGRQRNLWDAAATRVRGGFAVKAPGFWGTTRGAGAVVAVVDTGVRTGHPDLAGKLVPGYDFVDDEYTCTGSGDTFTCENDGTFYSAGDGDGLDADASDPGDWVDNTYVRRCGFTQADKAPSSWHGSHVAGIVGAATGNARGIAGVAPDVKIQPVRALGHCGGALSDIMLSILWASGANVARETNDPYYADVPVNATPADVINLSLGSNVAAKDRSEVCKTYGQVISVARAQGATIVAAAGNDSFTRVADAFLSVPATCNNVVSVAASSRTGHRAWYSQGGKTVDISAPGGDDIMDATSAGDNGGIWSLSSSDTTRPTGEHGYAQESGTSMAAPHVAAGAALLYAMGAADPARVEATLKASVTPFPGRSSKFTGVKVSDGRKTYTLADLNCTTARCGAGVLDVDRFNDRVAGTVAAGRTVSAQGWRRSLSEGVTFAWRIDGSSAVLSTRSSIAVPRDAVGRRLALTIVSPGREPRVVKTGTVARSSTSTTLSMASTVKRTSRPKATVRVSGPVAPTGTVRIYDGKKLLAKRTLSTSAKGTVVVTLPTLSRGTHKIRATYAGDKALTGSSSSTRTVTSR